MYKLTPIEKQNYINKRIQCKYSHDFLQHITTCNYCNVKVILIPPSLLEVGYCVEICGSLIF